MTMFFKQSWNYSQEGLEAVPPAPARRMTIRQANVQYQPDIPSFSSEPKHSSKHCSRLEKGATQDGFPPQARTVWGMPASTVLFAIIAALAIATAGVLGGLLGTRLASCPAVNCNPSSTNTTTPSSTSTSPGSFTTDSTVPLDCPALNNQIQAYTPVSGPSNSFKFICNNDCPSNNLVAIWSYSIDLCLDACVSFTQLNATGQSCGAATFRSVLSNSSVFGGNCFLKSGCPNPEERDYDDKIASAVLVT